MTPYLAEANITYRDFTYPVVKPIKKFIIRTQLQKEYRNGIINEEEVFSDVIEGITPEQLAFELENF